MLMVTGSLLEAQCSPRCLVPSHTLGVLLATRHSLGHSVRPPLSALHHPDYSTTPLWAFSTPCYSHSAISSLLWPTSHLMPTWLVPPCSLFAILTVLWRPSSWHVVATYLIFGNLLTVWRNLGHWMWILDAAVPSSQDGTEQSGM